MPKKDKPFDVQGLKEKVDTVRSKAQGVLDQRAPRAPFKERAKAEEALRATSHIQARRGFKDPVQPSKPKGGKPKAKGKTVHEKRREPLEEATGTDKTKRALEGVGEAAKKAAEAAKKKG